MVRLFVQKKSAENVLNLDLIWPVLRSSLDRGPSIRSKKSAENALNLDLIWAFQPPPKKNRPCGAERTFPAGAGPRTPICAIFATDSGWNLRGKPCSCDLIRS